ncbi:MAG TPA: deoxyribonuclease IV [Armatimonadetes bacterium]|nr:deoxyribonuclease IV [Armatimonadota bacterium]
MTSANLGAMLLIENSAGRGNELGYRLEHIAKLLDDIGDEHLGVCIDLCHAFAAGYDIHSYKGFERFWSDFERIIGISHLRAIHLSDCKGALGMHVDRHESLGKGFIGMRAFKLIARDARFATVPKILETPHHELHATELRILRNLMWNCPIP